MFTLESVVDAASEEEYRLNPHGCYSHDRDYVETVLRAAGYARVQADCRELRSEAGLPVHGWLVSAQREAPLD